MQSTAPSAIAKLFLGTVLAIAVRFGILYTFLTIILIIVTADLTFIATLNRQSV